jgi:epoxyqueuosine reductase
LSKLLRDEEPVLRGHAAWALGRIGRREGLAAVTVALEQERDDDVRREMVEALSSQASNPAGSGVTPAGG